MPPSGSFEDKNELSHVYSFPLQISVETKVYCVTSCMVDVPICSSMFLTLVVQSQM